MICEQKHYLWFCLLLFCITGYQTIGNTGDSLPIGTILTFAGANPPDDYLLCDGRLLDGADARYRDLYSVVETTYGPMLDDDGNPVVTREEISSFGGNIGFGVFLFRVPDLRGSFLRGAGNEENNRLGDMGGAKTHTLTIEEMPSHNHEYLDVYYSGQVDEGYYKGVFPDKARETEEYPSVPYRKIPLDMGTNGKASCWSAVGFQMIRKEGMKTAGGGQPHNNLPPYRSVNFIIKYR